MTLWQTEHGPCEPVYCKEEAFSFLHGLVYMLVPLQFLVNLHSQQACICHTFDGVLGMPVGKSACATSLHLVSLRH